MAKLCKMSGVMDSDLQREIAIVLKAAEEGFLDLKLLLFKQLSQSELKAFTERSSFILEFLHVCREVPELLEAAQPLLREIEELRNHPEFKWSFFN